MGVSAMDATKGAQVAALSYSGPLTMDKLKKCTGQAPKGSSPQANSVDMYTDCNLAWHAHFTVDTTTVANSIKGMSWRKGSTMTSQALAIAEAELINGRPATPAVVVA